MPDFEDAIRQTGWGLYHNFLVGLIAACAFSQSTAMMSVPLAIPIAACDLSMTELTVITIDVFLSIGMAIGGFIFCSLNDVTGRKSMLTVTLLIIFGSCFSAGFSHSSTMIVVCVFFLGCGLASNYFCVKIYLGEMLPLDRRGFYLTLPDLFWSTGYLLSILIAWVLTPSIIYHQNLDMRLTTWRLMFGLSGGVSIMVACASALLRNSPRYLFYTKKNTEAIETLKHIYAINNSKHSENYIYREQDLAGCITDYGLNRSPEHRNCTENIICAIKQMKKSTVEMTRKRFLPLTSILAVMKFSVLFGTVMINIWLSKMLHFGEEPDCYFTSVDVLHLEGGHNSSMCNFTVKNELYRDFLLIALNLFLGQLILMFVIDRLGRKISIVFSCLACGISSFALAYLTGSYLLRFLFSSIFMSAYSMEEAALNIVIIESYPTAIRGTTAGSMQFFAHIASGLVKRYLETPCQYSFMFMGSLMTGAAVVACFLPELKNRPMVE